MVSSASTSWRHNGGDASFKFPITTIKILPVATLWQCLHIMYRKIKKYCVLNVPMYHRWNNRWNHSFCRYRYHTKIWSDIGSISHPIWMSMSTQSQQKCQHTDCIGRVLVFGISAFQWGTLTNITRLCPPISTFIWFFTINCKLIRHGRFMAVKLQKWHGYLSILIL